MSERALGENVANALAEEILLGISESEPTPETLQAQEILGGTPVEHLYCLSGDELLTAIRTHLVNAFFDGRLTSSTPTKPERGGDDG